MLSDFRNSKSKLKFPHLLSTPYLHANPGTPEVKTRWLLGLTALLPPALISPILLVRRLDTLCGLDPHPVWHLLNLRLPVTKLLVRQTQKVPKGELTARTPQLSTPPLLLLWLTYLPPPQVKPKEAPNANLLNAPWKLITVLIFEP